MELTLKKIKFHDDMSEETTCFSADLIVDGKNIGSVKNDGHGGCHDYQVYGEDRKILDQLEKEAAKRKTEFDFEKLDQWVDEILYAEDKKKQAAKFQKKIAKKMETAIVIIDENKPDGYSFVSLTKNGITPIAVLLKDEQIKGKIHTFYQKIKMELKKGEKIVNTNLPKEWL